MSTGLTRIHYIAIKGVIPIIEIILTEPVLAVQQYSAESLTAFFFQSL